MSLTRRRFTQILASTLFLHHLPSFAQSVKFWASLTLPEAQNITRIVSAGAPADLLLLAVAPEKMVGFSSFDFARQALIPLPEHIRQLPRLGRLAGRASTLSLEGLMALHPDLVVDCGNTDETWISQARQVSEQTQIPWLLLNGKLAQSAEQLTTLGKTLGEEHRAAEQANLASRFVGEAQAFAASPAANLRFYAARGPRGLETGLKGSLHTEAAELLGLHNVAQIADRHGLTQVSMENLLRWQPDIILVQEAVTADFIRRDPLWHGVKAVAEQRILFLSGLPFGWLDAPPEKKIVVEADTPKEAIAALRAQPDVLQLDKFSPQQATEIAQIAPSLAPHCTLALTGGINLTTLKNYLDCGIRLFITSAPYYAAPADIKVSLQPAASI
ncbi:ABC transporter substrate-binding protein [Escherichia coli]|nr:ABC transporter substrate-binding protein [Escherichia coli]MCQ7027407.1 ABC transporter substrate-binding protein [Escherichia coli]